MISNTGQSAQKPVQQNITFNRSIGFSIPASALVTPEAAAAAAAAEVEKKPKMLWGAPTWFLLHSLAEKISEKNFALYRQDILNIVFTICTNLPCPECSEHAKKYLNDTVRYMNIRTKQELKHMLFEFHNYVNKHKKYAFFSREQLDEKYSRANMKNIIYNFLFFYQDKSKSSKLLATELYRTRIIQLLKEWFQTNISILE
jgi:hypothetical protein